MISAHLFVIFTYSIICSLVNAIFFFFSRPHSLKKKGRAIWDAMLVSNISQSSHRLLLLLLVGQCTKALLSKMLLYEGKNQFVLIFFLFRVYFPS